MKLKLALIGCGFLNQIVAEAMRNGYLPEYELTGVLGRNEKNTLTFAERFLCRACKTIEELMALEPDFNTSIGPAHDIDALAGWLETGNNEFFCDTAGVLGDPSGELLKHPHVNCMYVSSGRTGQAFDRLSEKVLDNIETFLAQNS